MIPMPRARFKSITIKVLIAVFAASELPVSLAMTVGMAYMDSMHAAQVNILYAGTVFLSMPVSRAGLFFHLVFIGFPFYIPMFSAC